MINNYENPLYRSKTYPKRIIISIIGIVILISFGVAIYLNTILRISSHFNISLSKYCIYEPVGMTVDVSGNIYVFGRSKPYGEEDYDVLLLEYNSSGNLLLNRTWDSSELDSGKDIISDSIGNIYITGRNETELILLKYNSSGYLKWNKTWNNSSSNDYADRIAMDNLGNIYIMGFSLERYPLIDIILLKYNSNGNLQWEKRLSYLNNSLRGEGIATDGLGDIYIVGTNFSSPRKTFFLKYNSLGDLLWKRIWANIRSRAIVTDSSGNIYVTGYTTDSQSFILKYNTTGELQWYKKYPTKILDIASPNDIALDTLGNIYTISESYTTNNLDVVLSKYDSSGNDLWNKIWEIPGTDEYSNEIELDNSDNIYVTARTSNTTKDLYNKDILLLKYNASGDLQWHSIWGDLNFDPRCL